MRKKRKTVVTEEVMTCKPMPGWMAVVLHEPENPESGYEFYPIALLRWRRVAPYPDGFGGWHNQFDIYEWLVSVEGQLFNIMAAQGFQYILGPSQWMRNAEGQLQFEIPQVPKFLRDLKEPAETEGSNDQLDAFLKRKVDKEEWNG
jgi:hypothetical protein